MRICSLLPSPTEIVADLGLVESFGDVNAHHRVSGCYVDEKVWPDALGRNTERMAHETEQPNSASRQLVHATSSA
jgi:hypothetical protein